MLQEGLKLVFAVFFAGCLTVLVSIRPGAKRPSQRKLLGTFILGLIVAGIFLTTQSLYVVKAIL